MEPLAPIVDRMREVARDELPFPQTGHVTLWDDGTFRADIYHSAGRSAYESIRYDRRTSEIYLERISGVERSTTYFTGGETLYEPIPQEHTVRVIETVEPPYHNR